MNVLVDFDFIVFLRDKYALMNIDCELSAENRRIMDYCEAIIQNFHLNRGLRTSFAQMDFETYEELKKLKERPTWETE